MSYFQRPSRGPIDLGALPSQASALTADQELAKQKLIEMRRSLAEWRAARLLNDELTRKGVPDPVGVPTQDKELQRTLVKYLTTLYPDAALPMSTIMLAEMVIVGPEKYLPPPKAPTAQGFFPIIIGIGLVLILMQTVSNVADGLRQAEERKLCARGVEVYCPQSSWWKWAALAGGLYFIGKETTIGERLIKKVKSFW